MKICANEIDRSDFDKFPSSLDSRFVRRSEHVCYWDTCLQIIQNYTVNLLFRIEMVWLNPTRTHGNHVRPLYALIQDG